MIGKTTTDGMRIHSEIVVIKRIYFWIINIGSTVLGTRYGIYKITMFLFEHSPSIVFLSCAFNITEEFSFQTFIFLQILIRVLTKITL